MKSMLSLRFPLALTLGLVLVLGSGVPPAGGAVAETSPGQPSGRPDPDRMQIGTNVTYLAGWTSEQPWVDDIPANPWSSGFNPWNPAFIADIQMYRVLRLMHWNTVNPLSDNGTPPITDWSQRRLPDEPGNFSDNDVGTSQGPGLAYEWQIDLANRVGADLWINLPIWVNDAFFVQLATLVHEQLDPGRKVYIELCNEVWNYASERAFATERGEASGLQRPDNPGDVFGTAMRWQAYRSAQMWSAFEQVWGDDADRVINVLAGWSVNAFVTEHLHLAPLFEEAGFNPTGALPEAYAIAPYFGGNRLPGGAADVFELLRTDIFEHRWDNVMEDSRLEDVRDQHAVVVDRFGIDLIAYEGGQHIEAVPGEEGGARAPNHDPRMYTLYMDYLTAVAPYFSLFVHYNNVANNTDQRSFGAKDATGQAVADAPKYRALRDWIESSPDILFDGAKISFIANSFMGEWGGLNSYLELLASAGLEIDLETVPARQSAGGWYWGMGLDQMTDALDRIEAEGDYDICVFLNGSLDAMRTFAERLTAACGEVVLLVAGGGQNPVSLGGAHESTVADSLADARTLQSEFPGLRVAPAALVFYDLAVNPPVAVPRVDYLYGAGNIHQNGLGTLVNAFTLFAVMTGQLSVGIGFDYDAPAASEQEFMQGDIIGLGRPSPLAVAGDQLDFTPAVRDLFQQRVDTLLQQWRTSTTVFD